MSGTTVIPLDDRPAHLRYAVTTDDAWRTESVDVQVFGHRRVTIRIEVDDGRWTVDGRVQPDLDGCVDIDLGWTPATNLLPIRRLGLAVGDAAEITTAWLTYPELELVPNLQRYTRTDVEAWRYESGPYDFALDTTADGIVTTYGDDLWVARAVDVT